MIFQSVQTRLEDSIIPTTGRGEMSHRELDKVLQIKISKVITVVSSHHRVHRSPAFLLIMYL